jgi:DNA-binding MarR family transcriptional regulator
VVTGGSDRPRSEHETIKSLNEQLGEPCFKSSTRILILVMLAMNKKLSSVKLRSLIGLGKGSLENHLEKLESAGYVKVRNVQSWGGTRQIVEITEKGLSDCRSLLQKIHSLDV